MAVYGEGPLALDSGTTREAPDHSVNQHEWIRMPQKSTTTVY